MSAIPAPVLADLIPGRTLALPVRALRTAALVLGGTAFLAIASQVAVPLPFTPVPVSLATGAVVLLGAGLGPRLGTASALLYLIAGMAGAPIFAEQSFGWAFASFGYVIGYVPAAYIAGVLARRAADRSVWKTAALAGASTIAAYVVGVPWLMAFLGVDFAAGLALGVLPFLIGDAVKMVAAALVLPGTWKVVDRVRGEK
ncbi:MAG TPA: biotin transporter BioY [Beutenbergiaceae bacterium]|nr:biotin transporter BioY [Beutenbergiaceae bacterium]